MSPAQQLRCPHAATAMLAVLIATSAPSSGDVRTGVNAAIVAETIDGGGGPSSGTRFANTGSIEPVAAGGSESGTTTTLHGFIAALTIAQITAYDGWTLARGLTPGLNAGLFVDPNQDGIPNIRHFAFDTDPLGTTTRSTKRAAGRVNIGGLDDLTLTVPVRSGAVFSGNPLVSTDVDGLVYQILGDTDLNDPWDIPMTEVVPAQDAGLPMLGDYDGTPGHDWQYRTFRLTEPVGTTERQFVRAGVSVTP